jgi:phosphoenolpyruvate carboxykinase (GTP)
VLRRDPFSMLPFCGYNMGDYFRHWMNMGGYITKPPQIYAVNWFRVDDKGKFLWPGFGDNMRVLKWIIDRVHGKVGARETPIGLVPEPEDMDFDGLRMSRKDQEKLFEVNPEEWRDELRDTKKFLDTFGRHIPYEIWQNYEKMDAKLSAAR